MKLSEHITKTLNEARFLVEGPSHEFNIKLNNAIYIWSQEAAVLESQNAALLEALEDTLTIHKNADSIPYGKVTEIAEFNVPVCLCELCIRTRVAIRNT